MAHLEGIDLDALVDRDGPLDVETAVGYALQVCEPLAEAHALGIVHRDIKPENLFLWSGGPGKDIVKVLDFGLAKQFGSPRAMAVTGPQDSMGSPCYMSPEQVTTPQSIDERTDIWSVGVVLHRLLTDTLPFDGNSILEVLSHVLSAAPLSLRDARPDLHIDPELDAIVARCLEKLPTLRYSSMNELAAALTAYLEHRRTARALPPPDETVEFEPDLPVLQPVFEDDNEKIRIPGVHARWPFVVVFAVLAAGAAIFQADRTGRIHVRALVDGVLSPVRLGADVPLTTRAPSVANLGLTTRGIFAAIATRDASGNSALRAEPERDTGLGVLESDPSAPLTDEERTKKDATYREYLRSEGLTPLNEVLPTLDAPASN